MTFTYDLNTNGCLIIRASETEREELKRALEDDRDSRGISQIEADALEPLVCNSELDWIHPEETGDLTDAPMLGIRTDVGTVFARWAYMDYQVRSFVNDLIERGMAVFVS